MSARQAIRKTLRAAIAFALTYLMVWGGVPAPALAEMAEEAMGEEPVAAPATSRGDANGKTSSPASTGQADAATTGGGEGELGTDVTPAAPVEGEPGSTPAAEAPTNTDGELGVQSGGILGDSEAEAAATTGATVSAQGDIAASGTWGTCPWELDVDGALTIYPGNAGTDKPWSDFRQYITSVRMVEQGGKKVVLPSSCWGLFYNYSAITTVDLSGADASNVTNMSYMFRDCHSLASLDLSGWDTSKVADMSRMFYYCQGLTSLDLSGWDTSKVTDMSEMFYYCDDLAFLDLSGWDTSKVTDMSYMFFACYSLASLDLSGWDTSNVTNMSGMFEYCGKLSSLDLSGWDTSKVTGMSNMFYDCDDLARLVLGEKFTLHSAVPTYTINGVSGWYSEKLQRLLTPIEFVARKGIADTYTKRPNDGDVDISGATVTLSPTSYAFDGKAKTPTPTVKLGTTKLTKGTDYGVTYSNNVHIGTATVTIQGWGTYRGTCTATFQITGDVSNAEVAPIADQTFSGSELRPSVTVTLDGRTLVRGTDYTLSYANNVNAGTATATVTGKGNYGGSKDVGFRIAPKSVTVTADDKTKEFGADDPVLTATVSGTVGTDEVAYTLSRATGEDYGEYAITPAGAATQGNYAVTYVPGKLSITKTSVARAEVAPIADQTFSGSEFKPTVSVTLDGRTLVAGTDYDVSYANNVNAGTATATVTGKGNYGGSKDVGFRIVPKPVEVPAAATGLVYDGTERTGVAEGEGYALTGDVVRRDAGAYTATATLDANHVWAGGSTEPKDVSWSIARKSASVSGRTVSKPYGSPDPELVTVEGLVGDDTISYDVSRAPGDAVGDYAITPSGEAEQGNYAVTYTPGTLTITPADISTAAEVDPIVSQLHTGSAITPEPVVRMGDVTLAEGTDYDLSYANNVEPGTATVTIAGKGNYMGTTTAEFSIGTRRLSDAELYLDLELYPASAVPARPGVSGYYYTDRENWVYEQLVEGRDFSVAYRGGEAVGQAAAVVTGLGDYVGAVELPFEVVDRVDISDQRARVNFWTLDEGGSSRASFLYRGVPVRPTIVMGPGPIVRGEMVEGRDYEVRYLACDGPGNAMAVVTGIGDYTGEQTVAYTIVEPTRISLNNASVTLENPDARLLNENSGQYLDAYLRKDGVEPRPVPRVTVGGAALVEGVDYEVLYYYEHYSESDPDDRDMGLCIVRGINGVSGETYWGFYVVDSIDVAWLRLSKYDLWQTEYRWEGAPVRPKLRPSDDFVEGKDYHLSYRNNNGAGTCVVTVTGLGRYYGSATIEVPIVEELSFTPYSECEIEVVEPAGGFVYDGSEKRPEVRVSDPKTGKALAKNRDYSVSYTGNVSAGTAVARVSYGIVTNRYGGYAEATFKIAKAPSKTSARAVAGTVTCPYSATQDVPVQGSNVAVTGAAGRVTYENASLDATAAKFSVGWGTCFVTVPRGTAPGTYQLRVRVTDAGDANHEGATKYVSYSVRVAFPDVVSGAWYEGVVYNAASLGVIGGYSNGNFGPNDPITRGQVAVVLWKMARQPAAGAGARAFPDVPSGEYYYQAVRWASSKGIVSGYGNGSFGPDDRVTREQLAAMLASYARNVAGRQTPGAASDYASMSDRGSVSDWAVTSVGWCFKNGILNGSGGQLRPQGNASRAEACKMVVALHDLL